MSEPKVTVIIPTRERAKELEKSLKTVTKQDYGNLEIIVSDNFSCDDTEDVVRSARDARVKYINTGKRVSMSNNWEFALSHVADGWVTIIGDDDGLLPASLDKVSELIRSTDIKAITSHSCLYSWPSLTGMEFGRMEIPLKAGFHVRNSKAWLLRVMEGRADYIDLPLLYTGGFVDMSVLNRAKSKTATFYHSCIPDLYSGAAISSVIESYIYSNEPLAIRGISGHSTGTSVLSGEATSDGLPKQKFSSEGNIPFHKDVPLCADGSYPLSVPAIMYESYLQSSFLRDVEWGEVTHAQQLEVILARAGRHRDPVMEWGKIFATAHGLQFDEIRRRAILKKATLRAGKVLSLVSDSFNTYSVGAIELPIKDVYEASIAAAEVRNHKPSRFMKSQRLFGRVLEKIIGA
jgi:hypothetical protein